MELIGNGETAMNSTNQLRSLSSTRDSLGGSSSKFVTFGSSPSVIRRLISSSASANTNLSGSGSCPGTATQSYSNTPRSSILQPQSSSTATNMPTIGVRGERVDLRNVYKVVRFYSFWKTCTSFHRIVTMIERVGDSSTPNKSTSNTSNSPPFTKRLFVQYLWRNAKPIEKSRVQKEFDPRRQRLLKFVTDPATRKRVIILLITGV